MRPKHVDIQDVIQNEFRANPPARLGIAVSGGSDSVALLHALSRAFSGSSTQLFSVTVDHGLRPEAFEEAKRVCQIAKRLNVSHDTLSWDGWDGQGNLQARAREARYDLMSRWAREKGIAVLALGHTADDQAETVLMRLARASGVDGLAGIQRRRMVNGVTLVRPLLDVSRADLQSYLTAHEQNWIDDPSNSDLRFERVRVRSASSQLDALGLSVHVLADVAHNMSKAREALDWYTFIAAREFVQVDGGDILIELRRFRTLPDEIARRLLVQSLCWIGGGAYMPRRDAVRETIAAIRAGKTATLHGCTVLAHGGLIWICREYNAVRHLSVPVTVSWDKRWQVASGAVLDASLNMRALGKTGLHQIGDWRQTGRPYAALMSSPSIWAGNNLICAPFAGVQGKVGIELIGGGEEFFASILSH